MKVSENFIALVQRLLEQDYAQKLSFISKTLEQVADQIEADAEKFDLPTQLTPEFMAEVESFHHCKEIVILLLNDLELAGFHQMPPGPLSAFLKMPQTPSSGFSVDEDAMSEKTLIGFGVTFPVSESAPTESASDKSHSTGTVDFSDPTPEPLDLMVPMTPILQDPMPSMEEPKAEDLNIPEPLNEAEVGVGSVNFDVSNSNEGTMLGMGDVLVTSTPEEIPATPEVKAEDAFSFEDLPLPSSPNMPKAEEIAPAPKTVSIPPVQENLLTDLLSEPDAGNDLSVFPKAATPNAETSTLDFDKAPELPIPTPASELSKIPSESIPEASQEPALAPSPFFNLAIYLESLKTEGSFPMETNYIDRLIAQQYCLAVEDRSLAILMPALKSFWPDRIRAVRALVDGKSQTFDLDSDLKEAVQKLSEKHTKWLPNSKVSFAAIGNTLRFITSIPKAERFNPTPFEAGVLFLFLAQDEEWEGFTLRNELGLRGLSSTEFIELSFRLFRIQKTKSRCSGVDCEFNSDWLETTVEDTSRILALLKKLKLTESAVSKVA